MKEIELQTISRINAELLKEFCSNVLAKLGVPKDSADIVSDHLVWADLMGISSHGVTRLGIYVKRLQTGLANAKPNIHIVRETPSMAVLDGDNGLGQVVGVKAVELAIEKASKVGVGVVGVRHTTHFGCAGYYALKAIEKNMIGVVMSNAPSTMAPWGARVPYLGTNPIAFGVPTAEFPPILLDMATSIVARGKIILAAKEGKTIPEGWAVDPEGEFTTNPESALKGAVLPFGGPKGSGIALMIDIFSGILSGAEFGSHIGSLYDDFSKPQNVGNFIMVFNVESFCPVKEFKERIELMRQEIKSLPKAKGVEEILLPGELEFRRYVENIRNGLQLSPEVIRELREVGELLSISFPLEGED
ncbi:MAG: Ldh family oxidoreductase [bacterium]|nr:Ldh family oxidoreductase [bacterium]